jgi:hypothetical protein
VLVTLTSMPQCCARERTTCVVQRRRAGRRAPTFSASTDHVYAPCRLHIQIRTLARLSLCFVSDFFRTNRRCPTGMVGIFDQHPRYVRAE